MSGYAVDDDDNHREHGSLEVNNDLKAALEWCLNCLPTRRPVVDPLRVHAMMGDKSYPKAVFRLNQAQISFSSNTVEFTGTLTADRREFFVSASWHIAETQASVLFTERLPRGSGPTLYTDRRPSLRTRPFVGR